MFSALMNRPEATVAPRPATAEAVTYRRPFYEVAHRDDTYEVRVHLPGVPKNAVEVSLHQDLLTVRGAPKGLPEGAKVLRRGLPLSEFRLQLRLNVEIEEGRIGARTEDGVLTLTLPKAEAAKPRAIAVE